MVRLNRRGLIHSSCLACEQKKGDGMNRREMAEYPPPHFHLCMHKREREFALKQVESVARRPFISTLNGRLMAEAGATCEGT